MPVDIYPDPVIVCSLALAPSSKKPEDLHLNSDVRFQIYAEKGLYGTVGEAARTLVEESHSNVFLPFILNRILDATTIGTIALELIYGSGYRTFIKRKDGLDVKSFKQMGICLKIGFGDDDDVEKLPILMPDDDLYTHLVNMAIDLDMSEPQKTPTIYICTGAPLFLFPTDVENQSTISLAVPNKRGFWTGATYDPSGEREIYPKELPVKAGTFTRKRKKPEESDTKAIEENNKKIKKESDEEETEEKPLKKKTGPKPKKATPKKTPPKKVVEKDDTDEEEEEKEKPVKKKAGRPKGEKVTPKKPPTPQKIMKDSDVDDESELEDSPSPEKPVKKKRKSTGSSSKSSKRSKSKTS